MEIVFQLFLDALLLSGFYTILSVGFSLMWGVTGIINLAYGSFIILGAYLSYMIYRAGFDVLLFLPLIFILGFLLGLFFQALFVNRLMGYEPFTILVLTFGFDVVITNLLNLIFKADIRSISLPFENSSLFIANLILPLNRLLVFFFSIISLFALYAFLRYSWTGRAIRAVSLDPVGAQLCGIDPKRVFMISTGIAIGLALFSGSFYAMLQGFTPFESGWLTIRAFLICVIAGLGSVSGLAFGSFILSIFEVFSGFYLGEDWKNVISLMLLIAFLTIRPRGLFGIRYHEKG